MEEMVNMVSLLHECLMCGLGREGVNEYNGGLDLLTHVGEPSPWV